MKEPSRKAYHDHLFMLEEMNKPLITYDQWCEMQNIRIRKRSDIPGNTDKLGKWLTISAFILVLIGAFVMEKKNETSRMGAPIPIEDFIEEADPMWRPPAPEQYV
mgnify:CR=1 FL=1